MIGHFDTSSIINQSYPSKTSNPPLKYGQSVHYNVAISSNFNYLKWKAEGDQSAMINPIAKWQKTASLDAPHLLSGVSEVRCIPQGGVAFCSPEPIVDDKKTETAGVCENTSNPPIEFNDGESCEGTSFYTIKCENKVTLKYDNGDDKSVYNAIQTTNNLLPGQGFEFGITAEIGKHCTGEFNDKNWQAVHDKIANQIKIVKNKKEIAKSQSDKDYLESLYQELLTKEEKIIAYANKYNDQKASLNVDVDSSLELTYET